MSTSWEDANRCPTCNQSGKEVSKRPAPDYNGSLITLACQSSLCPDTSMLWYVQVRADGSIPDAQDHTGKVELSPEFRNEELAQQIRDAIELERLRSQGR